MKSSQIISTQSRECRETIQESVGADNILVYLSENAQINRVYL